MMARLTLDLKPSFRNKLKVEFSKLRTVKQKIDFWNNRLERNYFMYDDYSLDDISDFFIRPKGSKEIEELNKYLIESSSLSYGRKYRKGLIKPKDKESDSLDNKIDLIKKEISNYENKVGFIETEMQNVKSLYKQLEEPKSNIEIATSSFFKSGYDDFYLKNREPEINKRIFEPKNLFALVSGYQLAKYYIELEKLKEAFQKQKSNNTQKLDLNLRQKIWVLEYLGVFKNLKDVDTHNAYFLTGILPDSINKIRPQLGKSVIEKLPTTKTEKVKVKRELTAILQELSKVVSKSVLDKIKSDIKNLTH